MTVSGKKPHIVLTIAGSDPSGGAGIQADIKTFTVLGVYGASILTSLTAQNTLGVAEIFNLPPLFIEQQAKTLASDIRFSAVKTGMLNNVETVQTVIDILKTYSFGPLIVDPVLQSTSGDKLLTQRGLELMRNQLLPLALLVTPNLFEASQLLGKDMARNLTEMENQASALLKLGIRAVLLKGGHLEHQGKAVDILATTEGITHFANEHIKTKNTHGTGCTLSAAIAAELAKGNINLHSAIKLSKDFVWKALQSAKDHHIGQGCGPIDHLCTMKAT